MNELKVVTKRQAIETINKIQYGSGVDREVLSENMRGEIAKDYWNDNKFGLGAEYGAIAILMSLFDITEEDLKDEQTSKLLNVEKYITPVVHSKAMSKITGV